MKTQIVTPIVKFHNGWTIEIQMAQELKKDGSLNKARSARATGWQFHIHQSGHFRAYKNGVLFTEKYV